MEYFKLALENPEATVQLIGAVVGAVVTICSLIIKFLPRTRKPGKTRQIINSLALNKPEGEK